MIWQYCVFLGVFLKGRVTLVTVAERGREAIEKLSTCRFDVAVIDFGLPDMEGTALFPVIQKTSPKTVKIMLTGKTFLQECVVGVDVFFGKPVNLDKLLSVIDTKVRLRDLEANQE